MAASLVLTSPSTLSTTNFPSTIWALQQDGSSRSPDERAALPTTENTGAYTEGSDNHSLHNSGVRLSRLSSTKIIILPCLSTTKQHRCCRLHRVHCPPQIGRAPPILRLLRLFRETAFHIFLIITFCIIRVYVCVFCPRQKY